MKSTKIDYFAKIIDFFALKNRLILPIPIHLGYISNSQKFQIVVFYLK